MPELMARSLLPTRRPILQLDVQSYEMFDSDLTLILPALIVSSVEYQILIMKPIDKCLCFNLRFE